MSLYDATLAPPQRYKAVEALRTLIAASGTIVTTGGVALAAHVFSHYMSTTPAPDRHIVVRERSGVGGSMQNSLGYTVVPIQVMASIDRQRPNVHQWLSAIHNAVYAVVVNQKPTITLGTMTLPFSRQEEPAAPALDDSVDEWYSTALYYAVIQPIV